MTNIVETLWRSEEAQDLVEYSLLIAFVLMLTAALVFANGGAIQGILLVTTDNLNAANQAAS